MYIPKQFLAENRAEAIRFMQQYSFGTLVTVVDGLPFATHLPFLIEENNGYLFISSHLAKANPQGKSLETQVALIIFSEPHAYISPRYYEKDTNVPTWNYVAVHAYGKPRLLATEEDNANLLERTIKTYEAAYFSQWESFPADYRSNMIKGITGFEILVTDLQAKEKLSQNRTPNEREQIIAGLSDSADTSEQAIASFMAKIEAAKQDQASL
jgi:transcriptional regulator